MRFLSALKNDIRYQVKYGFYFLYAFFSTVYITILLFCPVQYKGTVASIVILTDPAMLGIFFIGGIWLLEKREGLHRFWVISPLRSIEYILSKAASLAVISTIAAVVIISVAFQGACKFLPLFTGVFFGSMIFTVIGLMLATYAESVNQYMIITTLPAVILTLPGILAAFGISHPALGILPGTALWHIIAYALYITDNLPVWLWPVLAVWFWAVLLLAQKRISVVLLMEEGE